MWRAKKVFARMLCALLFLLFAGCTQEVPLETVSFISVPEKEYKTTTVVKGTIDVTLDAQAFYVYPDTKTLKFEYDNAILKESVSFPEGYAFKKGDILATFTFETSESELQRMELDYIEACGAAEDRIASYESRIAQYAAAAAVGGINGQIAALQKEQAENELAIYRQSSHKQLLQMWNELEDYRLRFEEQVLVAPEDGIVTEKVELKADTVCSENGAFLTYTTSDRFLLRLDSVEEEFLLMATPGMKVTISRSSEVIEGTIVASPTGIDADLDNRYIYVDSPELTAMGLKSYYTVSFTLLSLDNMLLLESKAVQTDENGNQYVMVLHDGVAVKQEVTCIIQNKDVVCVLDGLSEGQQVVIQK